MTTLAQRFCNRSHTPLRYYIFKKIQRVSNNNPIAMVDFVLNNLRGEALIGLNPCLERAGLVLHLDALVPLAWAGALQRKASFFGLVPAACLDDFGVEHQQKIAVVIHHNHPYLRANHVGGQPHTAVGVGGKGVEQILRGGQVGSGGGAAWHG